MVEPREYTPKELRRKRLRQWWRGLRLKAPVRMYATWVTVRLIWSPAFTAANPIVRRVATDTDWYDETQADWRSAMKGAVGRILASSSHGENFLRLDRARGMLPKTDERNVALELAFYIYCVRGV